MFILEVFTGGHCVGIYTTLIKAQQAYWDHCRELRINQPANWRQEFPTVWYIKDAPGITDASITEITADAALPFV